MLPVVMVPGEDRWGFPPASRFTLTDRWLGRPPDRDTSPAELVRRYLAALGPATPADAQAWSGLPGLRAAFEELRCELATFRDERGRELLDLPEAPRPPEDAPAPARFLPDFDNLVLAHDDRTRVVADEHRPAVVTKNLRVRATVLWDGFVCATWAVKRTTRKATLTVTPLGRMPRGAPRGIRAEGEALLKFLEPDAREAKLVVA